MERTAGVHRQQPSRGVRYKRDEGHHKDTEKDRPKGGLTVVLARDVV